MILVDTSVWIDHLRTADERLVAHLEAGQVLCHPFVVGELALGNLRDGDVVISLLGALPTAAVATPDEVLTFITRHRLNGRGLGYVDTHLLAATAITPEARLWSRDRRLSQAARSLGLVAAG